MQESAMKYGTPRIYCFVDKPAQESDEHGAGVLRLHVPLQDDAGVQWEQVQSYNLLMLICKYTGAQLGHFERGAQVVIIGGIM